MSNMSRGITVTYNLNPPAETPSQGLSASQTLHFPVQTPEDDVKKYYDGLRKAIAQAKDVMGTDLTAWRDAVGLREQLKEARVPKRLDEDEEEEDGGEP
ncbi:hypothetical protein PHLCEN_2v6710 [Hermanssonia centrifuga]|uniref:EKC/KEOPS complex subunit GON7 n=1 Tax=Hermanssonia centrifuga TaxID=98765 RepID=A0A2R6NYQ7_9APHY|nr:hypothetical protein PHLCEN_2v6710 [Hermanssonia centrifuga]